MVGINKQYQQYYTSSNAIVNYMMRLLEAKPGLTYLEPSAGSGIFIDEIDKISNVKITGYDIEPESVKTLQQKYKNKTYIHIENKDTLTQTNNDIFQDGESYDRIIGNPPYGAWQEYSKRNVLKKLYPNEYVKETYSLFLKQCINLLNLNGILVFIIPDTFLYLRVHTKLRKYILDNTNICEIALFPSRFFPGVQFGYSNLCIIKIQKKQSSIQNNNKILIRKNFKSVEELDIPDCGTQNYIVQSDLYKNLDYSLFVNTHTSNNLTELINSTSLRIGDIADCVTGFYSGNDALYLKRSQNNTKGKKYDVVSDNLICSTTNVPLDGIDSNSCYIPIMKGGTIRFYKPTLWYMNWSKSNVQMYKRSAKARYQNSNYYFREGIGVPMVSSTRISAALIEKRLFDQSIVGIFPKDIKLTYYLLGFFNSKICNDIIRTINPSTNNSASYLKKIPIIIPSDNIIEKITVLVQQITASYKLNKDCMDLESDLDNEICRLYNYSNMK